MGQSSSQSVHHQTERYLLAHLGCQWPHYVTLQSHQQEYNNHIIGIKARMDRGQSCDLQGFLCCGHCGFWF